MKKLLIRTACFFLTLTSLLHAQVPQLISYQGRVGVDGVNFDGSGQFKFAFVNAAGTDTYWSNDGSSRAGSEPGTAIILPVSKGLYAVLLGDATLAHMAIVPATVFTNGDVHLRVWFSDGVNGFQQLAPDRRIAAVGYAMMADSVSDGSITTAKIADGAVTSEKLAAGVVQTANLATGAVGNTQLANSGLTINAGTGLGGGGLVSLGGNLTLSNAGVLSLTGGGGINVDAGTGAITLGSNATSAGTAGAIVARDANGGFSAGTITAALNGNAATATTAISATNFTGTLSGDVTGSQSATTIADATVTGKLLTGFTSAPGTVAATDSILSAINKLNGNTALKAPLASPSFTGSVSLPAGSTTAAPLMLQTGTNLTTPTFGAVEFDGTNVFVTNNSASPTRKMVAFTDSTITSTQIAAGTVNSSHLAAGLTLGGITTGTFNGNVSGTAASFTGSLTGDVTGTQAATVVSTVGGVTSTSLAAGATLANAATHANTDSTLVARDASGNFSAGTITAALNGNAATATSTMIFTGALTGDVTGTQAATTIADATVTGKALTGFTSASGTLATSDTLLSAINKLDGNTALKAPAASPTFTGSVTLPAGTATAAPIQLQSGTNLTAPAFGAVEFDGTNVFVTNNSASPTRKTVAFTDSIFTATQINDGTITSAKLASGAAAANLNASGQSGVPSGGLVLATSENPSLVNAGYSLVSSTLGTAEWKSQSATSAPTARTNHTAIWTGSEMIIWGGKSDGFYDEAGFWNNVFMNTGGRYNPATDLWLPISTIGAPTARHSHAAVWTGTEMMIWGGETDGTFSENTGGRYNPVTGLWAPISAIGEPSAVSNHTAIWTGSEMIVWGGLENTGGRYNPATDLWVPISTIGQPTARSSYTAVWTGTEMIIWGGTLTYGNDGGFNDGWRYNPTTDSWSQLSAINAPSARYDHTAVWTGSKMIVFGGSSRMRGFTTETETGALYDPLTDAWTAIPSGNFRSKLSSAIWTGTEMIVWGGRGPSNGLDTGGRFNPVSNSWTTMSRDGPAARYNHTAVWTGVKMLIWGGYDVVSPRDGSYLSLNQGWIYTPTRKLYLYQRP